MAFANLCMRVSLVPMRTVVYYVIQNIVCAGARVPRIGSRAHRDGVHGGSGIACRALSCTPAFR